MKKTSFNIAITLSPFDSALPSRTYANSPLTADNINSNGGATETYMPLGTGINVTTLF